MDWISLAKDPNWIAFWKGEYMDGLIETVKHQIIHGSWSDTERARLRGRLECLEMIPRIVDNQAEMQLENEQGGPPPTAEEVRQGTIRRLLQRL